MDHPFLEENFRVHWSRLTPDHVRVDIEKALETAQANIDALADQLPEELTFENTMLALEEADEQLNVAWGKVGHLNSVKDSKELREAYNLMLPKVSEFHAKIPLNEGLWRRIKAYSETDEAQSLTGIRKRYLEETLASFKNSGADLPPEKKQRMEEIQAELAKLTQKYSENCLDAINAWEMIVENEADLAGLPALARDQALQSAKSKGLGSEEKPVWRFTLHAPSLLPILKYADKEDLRKTVWQAFNEIGTKEPYDNHPLVGEVLALRQEKAELLGFKHFADLVLERRMAKNGERALAFEDEMHAKIKTQFDRENAELDAFRCEQLGIDLEPMEPWDVGYWAEKYRQSKYEFDEEELRPYFPVNRVLDGMFEITQKLFGVTIRKAEAVYYESPSSTDSEAGYEVWNDDVEVFEIFDDTGAHTGTFYTDWFPRESKRSGAWMNYTLTGDRSNGKKEPHLGQIHGNMSPPTNGNPALLSHRDVETVFHEFGHLIHHLFGNVEIKSMNGVNVAWDFVELPSQIMENWCWDRKGLDLFARHFETGETIPEDLYRKMIAARNFHAASFAMRQLSFGKMDLEMHIRYQELKDCDLEAELEKVLQPYLAKRKRKAPVFLYNFGHLFSSPTGYAAGYYSYKWAEVLDADAFTRFEKEGLLNPETGQDFKEKILSKGNSEDPLKLFVDFMGREPDPEALLR
ncbi:MAG: M3 family metallopeptidase, partial [Verrucomicrobiae bacterium]|nr:M3 family metallopeptidase [Verrucomicrobiae bacterium]